MNIPGEGFSEQLPEVNLAQGVKSDAEMEDVYCDMRPLQAIRATVRYDLPRPSTLPPHARIPLQRIISVH